MADFAVQLVKLEHLSAAVFGVSLFFIIICPVVIAARIAIRARTRCFDDDDYLMCTAAVRSLLASKLRLASILIKNCQVCNLAQNCIAICGVFSGIGSPSDMQLNFATITLAIKVGGELLITLTSKASRDNQR
jgi:hypothetical protein